MTHSFARYLCLSVDAQGYSRKPDHGQSALQDDLLELLGAAAAAAGLDRRAWYRQGSGDGELALIPPAEPEARVVDDFVRELATLLFQRNCDRPATSRLRLRLAADHGLVRIASNGFAGHPVVAVSRLVNSQPVRQALVAADDANLAVILSRRVYTDLVLGGHTRLHPQDFRLVMVREKEFRDKAWVRVPGVDVHRLPVVPNGQGETGAEPGTQTGQNRPAPAARADISAGRRDQVVVNEFAAQVDIAGGVIGIQNNC